MLQLILSIFAAVFVSFAVGDPNPFTIGMSAWLVMLWYMAVKGRLEV